MLKIKDNISYVLVIVYLSVFTSMLPGKEAAFSERLLPAFSGAVIGLVAISIYVLLFRKLTKSVESNTPKNKVKWAKVWTIGFVLTATGLIISFYIHGQTGYILGVIGIVLGVIGTIFQIKSQYEQTNAT